MTLRCLIVDDSRRFVAAARGLLERQGIMVVGVAATSTEAVQKATERRPDIAPARHRPGWRAALIWPGDCPEKPAWRTLG